MKSENHWSRSHRTPRTCDESSSRATLLELRYTAFQCSRCCLCCALLEVDASIGRCEMAAAKLHFRLQIAFYLLPGRAAKQIAFYPSRVNFRWAALHGLWDASTWCGMATNWPHARQIWLGLEAQFSPHTIPSTEMFLEQHQDFFRGIPRHRPKTSIFFPNWVPKVCNWAHN